GDAPGSRGMPFWDEVIPADIRSQMTLSVERTGGARELIERLRNERRRHAGLHPRVSWGLGPATPEICSEEFLQLLAEESAREKLQVFCHVYESKANAVTARNRYTGDGGSLIRHLARVGLLGPRLTIAHGVWLTRAEIDQMAAAGAQVALNPLSNLKTRSGVAPIRTYLEAGVKVGLGTDNSSCSDAQNLFQAMKLFALISGGSGAEAFCAATIGSAEAIELAGELGRIAPGHKADVALLDLRDPAFVPLNDAVAQLVYTESGRAVRHAIVDGRVVLRDGRAALLDEDALYAEIERLMPVLARELDAIRARNARVLPYLEEANRRTAAVDIGLDRFVPAAP